MYDVKNINNMTPSYLSNLFTHVSDIHPLNTRQSKACKLYVPKCNTNYGKGTFNYKGSVIWNIISKNLREAGTFMSFKANFKKQMKL